MGREPEGYREQIEWFSANYPGVALFNQKTAAKVLNCTPRTAKSRYGIDGKGIGVTELARMICRINKNAAQCWRTGRQ